MPAAATIPVHGSAEDLGRELQMSPGPAGDVYVLIWTEDRPVLALLDLTGKPRAGWPVAVDAGCDLPASEPDGSIRLICGDRVRSFTPGGRSEEGWPMRPEVHAAGGTFVGDDLYAMGFDGGDFEALWISVAAPDGTVRTGPRVDAPQGQDVHRQLGPDGTGYLLTYPNEPPESATGVTEIIAFDVDGVRDGWPVSVKGRASDLGFGRDGRVYVTEGRQGRRQSRILAFDRDGRALQIGSGDLPVVQTSARSGASPVTGRPPVVSEDEMVFLLSEDRGTTAYALDASGDVLTGWPYRDSGALEWSYSSPEDGVATWRLDPAVGPSGALHLLHPPRAAGLGGSIVAIGADGRVRPGWPVVLKRPGSHFRLVEAGPDGTVYALAVEPEGGGRSSATILAFAPDSTVLYSTTIIEP